LQQTVYGLQQYVGWAALCDKSIDVASGVDFRSHVSVSVTESLALVPKAAKGSL